MTVEFVGPFEHHDVVVDGRVVPYLQATPFKGGMIQLTLDHRFSRDLSIADAEHLVPFIADCIAVAMGYTCHPRPGWDGPVPLPAFRKLTGL